ncbi:MAG: ABC transporter ATP-binding protein [Alphaproteobacteria bacterium]|nr:ABC transporter ATP-binding protein [Alphaproteobacteria bacterium]
MSTVAIDLRRVEKWFGTVGAVVELDLQVRDGEFVALLGSSGCGKTTTLRMIAGLEQPTSGDIFLKDRRINDVPVHKRNVGMVFQNHALFPHKTAFDNIAFGLKYRKVPKPEIQRRVRAALELVRLPHVEERLPSQLSGGQQQRIAVARAIVIEPDILLFDEPLSSLDAGLREEMRIELKRIQRTLGITTVFVTHDQAEALSMSDRVVVMHDGRKEQEGTPEDVFRRPTSEFVTRFFGFVNELTGTVVGDDGGCQVMRIADGVTVRVAGKHEAGRPIKLLLRAERARVGRGFAPVADVSIIPATVRRSDYLGMLVRYFVDAAGQQLQVIQPLEGSAFRDGERVELRVRAEDWIVL